MVYFGVICIYGMIYGLRVIILYRRISNCPTSFVENIILSPFNYLGIFVKNQVTIICEGPFITLYSISLICMSISPESHSGDYSSFLISLEIWKSESSSFVIFQNCSGWPQSCRFSLSKGFWLGSYFICTPIWRELLS